MSFALFFALHKMSTKNSFLSTQKNVITWTNSLKTLESKNNKFAIIKSVDKSLSELKRMPKEKVIIGRFNALLKEEKCKTKRYDIISKELISLCNKNRVAAFALTSIKRKVKKLIQKYQKFLKHSKSRDFNNMFTITSKIRYYEFSDSNADMKKNSSEIDYELNSSSDSNFESAIEYDSVSDDDNYTPPGREKNMKKSLNPAVNLVTQVHVSTKKAAKICKHLAESGVNISTPSQAGIYKAVMKSAERQEIFYLETLQNELWCIHFDGKKIDDKEIQVIVLKNECKEIKLAVLVLDNGKALTLFNGIKEVLNKFNLWNSIKMIICDTTSVNTGKKNGVVTLLQNHCASMGLVPPQYIGCQHHILDLILRHIMDDCLEGKASSPNICYDFVHELINNYENLKKSYKQNEERIKVEDINWRDDMQYLYELGKAFRYYQKNKKFPYINFKAIPPIHNARWNSRAILAILTFILIPKYRQKLYSICKFVCGPWYDVWFSDHCFKENNFEALKKSLLTYKSARECFLRHWVQEPSAIPGQQRSNICAERAIKTVQDIYPLCKSSRTLNLKFISYNK